MPPYARGTGRSRWRGDYRAGERAGLHPASLTRRKRGHDEHQAERTWFHAALIVVLAVWILHDFVQAILAACVAAVASWPLFVRFRSLLAPWLGATRPLATGLMTCSS